MRPPFQRISLTNSTEARIDKLIREKQNSIFLIIKVVINIIIVVINIYRVTQKNGTFFHNNCQFELVC